MTCKNCGAALKDNARVCTSCGAFVDDESGYTLLTADDRIDDYYSFDPYDEERRRRKRGVLFAVLAVAVIALSSLAGLYFLNHIMPKLQPSPQVEMTAASGIINENEKIVYVTLKNSSIEKIHGVSLIDTSIDSKAVLSSNYEYTKNIDDTFRTVFFDTAGLELQKGKTYQYTFEIKLSFSQDSKVYTYSQPISFDGDISGDAADIIFDHSLYKDTDTPQPSESEASTESTTKQDDKVSLGFLYKGFWYTVPVSEGNVNTVAALEFGKDKTVKRYTYTKEGDGEWQRSDSSGSFTLQGNLLTVTFGRERLDLRVEGKQVFQLQDGSVLGELASRKYNSAINAQTFFDEE